MRFLNFLSRAKSSSTEHDESNPLQFWSAFQDKQIQIAVYILIAVIHLLLISAPFIQRLEFVFLDSFFRHRPALSMSPDIVFVEIAQDSIDKIGRWPWPRRYHAALLGILEQWKVRSVVFDAFFSEPSADPFDDDSFSQALAKINNVYAGTVIEDLPRPIGTERDEDKDKVWVHSIPAIHDKLKGVGHVNVVPDLDGITRHVHLERSQNGETHRYLGVEVALSYLADLRGKNILMNWPLDSEGRLLINWAARWEKSFKHYSYWDVLQSYAAIQKGEKPIISPESLQGKMVMVGVTASGLTDIKGVPLQSIFPGVGVIANVMNSIIINRFVREASWRENAMVLLFMAFGIGFLFFRAKRFFEWVGVFFAAASWVGIAFLIFCKLGIYYQVVNPLFLNFSFFVFSIIVGFLRSQNEQSVLYRLATRDGLTGLYTIRHMRSLLESSVIRSNKNKRPLSVMMTDVDFFKKVNDTYGHDAGDQVLKDLARLMELHFSELSQPGCLMRVGRYGGEEFLVFVEGYTGQAARIQFGEPLRKRVEDFQFNYQGIKIPVTISLGISELRDEDRSPDDLVKRADEALYRAKHGGRNRVEIS